MGEQTGRCAYCGALQTIDKPDCPACGRRTDGAVAEALARRADAEMRRLRHINEQLQATFERVIAEKAALERRLFDGPAAKRGDDRDQPTAETLYRDALLIVDGSPDSRRRAAEILRAAADMGHVAAMVDLGVAYEQGDGVDEDAARAVEWYLRATEAGNATAQCNLGYCHFAGRGVPRNAAQAVVWYRRAADNGSARAYNNLGYCYKRGEGVSKNERRAYDMYKTAAMKGDADGVCNAAWRLGIGTGHVR